MIRFKTIGTGQDHVTSTGKKSIRITFNIDHLFNVPRESLEGGVFAFVNNKKKNSDEPDYTLMAKVDDSGLTEIELRELTQQERTLYFADWLFSKEGQEMIDSLVEIRKETLSSQKSVV